MERKKKHLEEEWNVNSWFLYLELFPFRIKFILWERVEFLDG